MTIVIAESIRRGMMWDFVYCYASQTRKSELGQRATAPHRSAAAPEFEWKLQELGLTNETCVSSVQFRTWCAQNKNHRYIPEWLLKAWQMQVDPDLSSAA
jgi:hypothetical protein